MDSYRDVLKNLFSLKQAKNPRYSLRSFARDLRLPPSHLSRILSGQRHLSTDRAETIARELFAKRSEQKRFVELVRLESARTTVVAELGQAELAACDLHADPVNLASEELAFISNWYHIAILEFSHVAERFDVPSIAKRFGLARAEAQAAVDRLLRLGLLEFKSGRLKSSARRFRTQTDIPSEAIRAFHKQMIEKAKAALEAQPVERRYITAQTIPIRREDIARFKDLIESFKKEVSVMVQAAVAGRDDVYQLNIQFFSLSESEVHAERGASEGSKKVESA